MDSYVKNGAAIRSSRQNGIRAILGLVALGVVLIISGVIFGKEVMISLKDYNLFKGISGSPWVGLKNYRSLLENIDARGIIANTLIYNLLFACFCFFISSIIGLVVSALPKKSILRDVLAVLTILPVFIPDEVYAAWFINLLGSQWFIRAEIARFLIPLIAALKYAGIPIYVTHILGILKSRKDTVLPIKCAGLFSLVSLSLAGTGNFSIVNQLYNPLTYKTSDIFDTYYYRSAMVQMRIGDGAAAGVLQCVICMIFMVILFVPIKTLFKSAFDGEKEYVGYSPARSLAGGIIALVVYALLYLSPIIANGSLSGFKGFKVIGTGNDSLSGILPEGSIFLIPLVTIILWIVVSAVAALLGTGLAFAASGFAEGGKTARMGGVVLLALITVLTVRPFTLSGYTFIRSMGMINTYMAIIAVSIFSSAAVWAFAAMRRDEYTRSARGLLFGAVGLFLIMTALVYSDGMPALLYLNKANLSPLLMYRQLVTGMQSVNDHAHRAALYSTLGVSGLLLSLPALLAFLLAKVLLPAEAMLAVISGGKKH